MTYIQTSAATAIPSQFVRATQVGSLSLIVDFLNIPQANFTEPLHSHLFPIPDLTISTSFSAQQQNEADFNALKDKWLEETRSISSPSVKYLHPCYARIIGLGQPAVPMILQTLQTDPGDWFYALRAITGENPVTDEMAGDVRQMTQAWLAWGREKGVL